MNRIDTERLRNDLHMVAEDVELLLQDVADGANERGSDVRNRLHAVRERLVDLEEGAADRVRAVSSRAVQRVREQPWVVIGATAAAAFALGLLSGRRGSRGD